MTEIEDLAGRPESGEMTTRDRRLHTLLTDYTAVREDERNQSTLTAAFASVAVALAGGITALIVQTCAQGSAGCPSAGRNSIPGILYAFLPLPPVLVLLWAGLLGMESAIRSIYIRIIERQIADLTNLQVALDDEHCLKVPSITHILHCVTSPLRGFRPFQIIWLAVNVGIVVIAGSVVVLSLGRVQPKPVQISAVLMYTLLIVVAGFATRRWVRGHEAWITVLERLPHEWHKSMGIREPMKRRSERSLWSWVLLPRIQEIIKLLWLPIGWMLGWLITGRSFPLSYSLIFFVVFELVVYQGRYALNDMIDREIDAADRSAAYLKFPISSGQKGVRIGLVSILARAGLLVTVCFLLGGRLGWGLGSWAAAVIVIAVPYELLRNRVSKSQRFLVVPTRLIILLYVWVGAGYGVRVAAGVWLGAGGEASLASLLSAAVGTWALGVALVTMTWALGATKFIHIDGDLQVLKIEELPRVLYKQLHADKGYMPELGDQAHKMPLLACAVRSLADRMERIPADQRNAKAGCLLGIMPDRAEAWDGYPQNWKLLAAPTDMRSVWNLSYITALVLSAPLTAALATRAVGVPLAITTAVLVICLPLGLYVSTRPVVKGILGLSVALVALYVAGWILKAPSPHNLIWPPLLGSVIYLYFRSANNQQFVAVDPRKILTLPVILLDNLGSALLRRPSVRASDPDTVRR